MNPPRTHRGLGLVVLAFALAIAGCQTTPYQSVANRKQSVALTAQAEAAKKAGDLKAAMKLFEQALMLDRFNTAAVIGVGDVNQLSGNYAKAAKDFEHARAMEPGNYQANYKLGLVYHLLNRLRDAVRSYLAALTINPSSFDANLNLATAYFQLDQAQLALPYAQRAVELDPDSAAARVNLGAIYSAVGDDDNALAQYRAASEIPGAMDDHLATNLADAQIKTGHVADAVATLSSLIAKAPSASLYERLGYAQFKLGKFDDSLAAYRNALKLEPDNIPALNGLGVNLMARYLQSNRNDSSLRDQAVASWQKSIRLDRNQPKILDLISRYARL